MNKISRAKYADMYGATVGDRIRLAEQLNHVAGDSADAGRKEAIRKIHDQIREAEHAALLRLEGWETED